MAEQMRPSSKQQAPDPSDNYERSHPEHEAGQGRLDTNAKATPTPRPDKIAASVANAQDGAKQINAHDAGKPDVNLPPQPDHSMNDEEPMGWDQTSSAATPDVENVNPAPAVKAVRRMRVKGRTKAEQSGFDIEFTLPGKLTAIIAAIQRSHQPRGS